MNVWVFLVIGIIIGWVIGWIIDIVFWRGRYEKLEQQVASLTAENETLEAELENKLQIATVDSAEIEALQIDIDEVSEQHGALKTQLLNAQSEIERLKQQRSELTGSAESEMQRLRDKLSKTEAKLNETEEKLVAADAKVNVVDSSPQVIVKQKDDLKLIHGIGKTYERRLNKAGVQTFAEMGALTVDRVIEIVKAKQWQATEAPSWLEQAKLFASGMNEDAVMAELGLTK